MFTKQQIVDLYRKAASDLPKDVEAALARAHETDKNAKEVLKVILENVALARKEKQPMCQDTGTPFFYVGKPKAWSEAEIRSIIEAATNEGTRKIPLRPNAVEPFSGKELGNIPVIHFRESSKPAITLMLKGGGSENITQIYSLPDKTLGADRTLDGVRHCVLDAVQKAQGKGCPPYILGVAVGGSVEEVAHLAKEQLLRKLDEKKTRYATFEHELVSDINKLTIGPMGLGGKTTALAVKFAAAPRHPASFFVCVSFGCWSLRRATLQ